MKKGYILLVLIAFGTVSFSQIVYEPLYSDVYNYLERLSQKGIIEFNDQFKPLPRKYLSEKLEEAKVKSDRLTDLEKDELEFFEKEYFLERSEFGNSSDLDGNSGLIKSDSLNRLRLFYYKGKYLKLNVNPILGYDLVYPGKDRYNHNWNGIDLHGYLPGNLGFSFDFRINNESGTGLDRLKDFTPETGIIRVDHPNSFDYSEVKTSFTYDWGWGNIGAAKEFMEFGYGKSGKLILSNKAPSFPFILFQLKPAGWINFIYFHGWLSSNVIDSMQVTEYRRDIYISKYFAWHTLMITPLKGLDISIGESIVYGDKLEISYLMPFMFFFLADDFISSRVDKPGDGNSQGFITISSKNHIKNTHLYGTLFVDELTLQGVNGTFFPDNADVEFKSKRIQMAYTLGVSVTDLPVNNLGITLEYTKIYPFVYGHHEPAQTYTNSSYLMGHWMGHNGDLVHLQFDYRFLRGLQMELWGEYIRKGSTDYSLQYAHYSPPFLFGLKKYYKYFGVNLKYELINGFNIEAKIRSNRVSDEVSEGYFMDSYQNEVSLAAYYGL